MLSEESAQIMPSQDVEELRARIDKVADIIVHFSKTQRQIEKTVKQELEEILEDAERLKIDREEVRRMLREAFNTRTDFRIVLAKIIAR
jgi:regulator of replication initiation timing